MNIHDAELAIARILADVEAASGDWVEGIRIKDHEITTVGSVRPEFTRRVKIDMKPMPGSSWET